MNKNEEFNHLTLAEYYAQYDVKEHGMFLMPLWEDDVSDDFVRIGVEKDGTFHCDSLYLGCLVVAPVPGYLTIEELRKRLMYLPTLLQERLFV